MSMIIIVDGPDCAGKTTLIGQLKSAIFLNTADIFHHGAYLNASRSIGRFYVESMLPALLDYEHVILDRSWLSEAPYALGFRKQDPRLDAVQMRIIERVALSRDALVIRCLPTWKTVEARYRERMGEEYVDNLADMRSVYDHYAFNFRTQLNCITYDYAKDNVDQLLSVVSRLRIRGVRFRGVAGNHHAPLVLVGEGYAPHNDLDTYHQFPFCALRRNTCSYWLTAQLVEHGIPERELFWCNADHPMLEMLVKNRVVVTLGKRAYQRVSEVGAHEVHAFRHPQSQRRFQHHQKYPLIPFLKEALNV